MPCGGSADRPVVVTLAGTVEERLCVRLLIESIRTFGGSLGGCPVWLYEADPLGAPCGALEGPGVTVLPLDAPQAVRRYVLGAKVAACARAEERAGPAVRSLVWLSPDTLTVRPPRLFDLGEGYDAAVRPVHLRNIGLLETDPVDGFWKRVYEAVGAGEPRIRVESFVEGARIRAYFNTHAVAVNPSRGLFRRWLEVFEPLVGDREFQAAACGDRAHQVFLHQAVLSAIIAASLEPERIRMLPPEYSYPYHLQQAIPPIRRAAALNDLVTVVYEDRPLHPDRMDDIEVREPLRSHLVARATASSPPPS